MHELWERSWRRELADSRDLDRVVADLIGREEPNDRVAAVSDVVVREAGARAADRLARLDAAAGIAAGEPARMLAGDLVERLPGAVGPVPDATTAVVFHTAVLPYLDGAARAAFADLVRSLPVRWIAQEPPGAVPGTGEPWPGGWGPEFVLSLDGRPLARTAPHGGRIAWLDR